MKSMKKLTSLVLALAMVFAVSVTAFAAPAGTPTVQIKINGVAQDPITVASGVSLQQAIENNFAAGNPVIIDGFDYFWPTVPANYMISFFGLDNEYADPEWTPEGWLYESDAWTFTVNGSAPMFSVDETPEGYEYVPDHEKAINQYIIKAGDEIVVEYAHNAIIW